MTLPHGSGPHPLWDFGGLRGRLVLGFRDLALDFTGLPGSPGCLGNANDCLGGGKTPRGGEVPEPRGTVGGTSSKVFTSSYECFLYFLRPVVAVKVSLGSLASARGAGGVVATPCCSVVVYVSNSMLACMVVEGGGGLVPTTPT